MTHTYSIKGISCNGCVGHVKEQLEKHPDVKSVDIPKIIILNILGRPKKAVISMNQHISLAELQRSLDKDSEYAGKYSIYEPKA